MKNKRINSRTKGSTFERKIAKLLSKWSGINLRRTPLSGGWSHTIKPGDLTVDNPIDELRWKLSIECKKYKTHSFALQELIFCPVSSLILKWWKQASSDAKTSQRIPLLIFSQNFDAIYIMFNILDFNVDQEKLGEKIIYWKDKGIMTLSQFLENFNYDEC